MAAIHALRPDYRLEQPRNTPLDIPPYVQRSDDLGEQCQAAAARSDLLLRVFDLEWQDALRYHAVALLVKDLTHRVRLFNTISPYTRRVYLVSPLSYRQSTE